MQYNSLLYKRFCLVIDYNISTQLTCHINHGRYVACLHLVVKRTSRAIKWSSSESHHWNKHAIRLKDVYIHFWQVNANLLFHIILRCIVVAPTRFIQSIVEDIERLCAFHISNCIPPENIARAIFRHLNTVSIYTTVYSVIDCQQNREENFCSALHQQLQKIC